MAGPQPVPGALSCPGPAGTVTPMTGMVWPTPASGPLDGPFEQGFYVHVPGAPVSKSNHRHDRAHRAQWATLKAYAARVAWAARAARPRGWVTGDPAVPVAGRPRVVVHLLARSLLDAGNLDKSVLDAVSGHPARAGAPPRTGVLMASDAQVAAVTSHVVRDSGDQGLLALFARLGPTATPAQVADTVAALARAAVRLTTPR